MKIGDKLLSIISILHNCNLRLGASVFDQICNISALNYISYVLYCPTLILSNSISEEYLSFDYLLSNDKFWGNNLRLVLFECGQSSKELSLCVQVHHFFEKEPNSITAPLQNLHKIKMKYSDDIQVLAL